MAKKTMKKKTTRARKASAKRTVKAKKTSVKRTYTRKPKAVAFYKQPVVALSNGFDRVLSIFK